MYLAALSSVSLFNSGTEPISSGSEFGNSQFLTGIQDLNLGLCSLSFAVFVFRVSLF
jgi:hypothetical protein